MVNYFVSRTKRALVPFLLDDDYEKVLGGCGFGDPGGGVSAPLSLHPCSLGTPPGHPWPLRLLQAALCVPGYVEADKENGESVWVVPSSPDPGDAPLPTRARREGT